MHKKDRPMLSVTALLYGSAANSPQQQQSQQILFAQQQQQQHSNGNGINSSSISPSELSISPISPLSNSSGGGGNNLTIGRTISPIGTPTTPTISPSQLNCDNNNNNKNNNSNSNGTGNGNNNNNNNNMNNMNGGGPRSAGASPGVQYPPNHPLSGSKHLCAICEDRASGKHYGVYSCEGCKGFFKRTVRKDLTYVCRDEKRCIVDKRQRNRCQYCRYQKCLEMGMKREAVQEERQRNKPENEVESSTPSSLIFGNHAPGNVAPLQPQQQQQQQQQHQQQAILFTTHQQQQQQQQQSNHFHHHSLDHSPLMISRQNSFNNGTMTMTMLGGGGGGAGGNGSIGAFGDKSQFFPDLTIEKILDAELQLMHSDMDRFNITAPSSGVASREIELLFRWLRNIPYFGKLSIDDQVTLLRTGWNELLIAEFSYRSIEKQEMLMLANGSAVSRFNAEQAGVENIMDRILRELVAKFREMKMDRSELGCLRAIVLLNPVPLAIEKLQNAVIVENLRDRIYSILEMHCRQQYPDQSSRFAKLLVRLPALRSIGLKCNDHLFLKKFFDENKRTSTPIDSFIRQQLKNSIF